MGGTRSTGDGPRPGSPTVAVAALPGFPARPPACAARARRPRRGGGSSVTQGSASPRVTVPRGGAWGAGSAGLSPVLLHPRVPAAGSGWHSALGCDGDIPRPFINNAALLIMQFN